MIILDKVRLINWHYFLNETVDIDKITFLTGANGTGKSTIIDALQIVLTGDTTGRNFNKAAFEKTGRSLKGYLCGETGADSTGEVHRLRNGRFSSYVALQFVEDSGHHFTLGIVFDCNGGEIEGKNFFYINDSFPGNNFTNSDKLDSVKMRPLSRLELIDFLRTTYEPKDYQIFDVNLNFQKFLREKLGNLPDKFFTLFKKAVGFTPITDIARFITEFVCDIDFNIDIQPLKDTITSYKSLELAANKMQERIKDLQEIEKAYENYKAIQSALLLSSYLSERARYEQEKLNLDNALKQLENKKREKASIEDEYQGEQQNIRDLEAEKEKVMLKKVNTEGYQMANSISTEIEQLNAKITAINNSYSNAIASINTYINNFQSAARDLINRYEDEDVKFLNDEALERFNTLLSLAEDINGAAFTLTQALEAENIASADLKGFASLMSNFSRTASTLSSQVDYEIYNKSRQIDDINRSLEQMRKGTKPYSSEYLEIKNELLASLKARHDDAFVDTYGDLIDIKEERWVNVIEGILRTNKFNFFVNDDYFEEACHILFEILKTHRANYSIVDASSVIDDNPMMMNNSLAAIIETKDEGARAYTNYLLGKIKCCETYTEARESRYGMCPDGKGYRSYALWSVHRNPSEPNFIGTNISSDEMFKRKTMVNDYDRLISYLHELNDMLQNISRYEVINSSQLDLWNGIFAQAATLPRLNENLKKMTSRLEASELDDFNEVDKQLNAINEDIQVSNQNSYELSLRVGALSSEINNLENLTIPTYKKNVSDCSILLEKYDQSFVKEIGEPYFENALMKSDLATIVRRAPETYVSKNNQLTSCVETLKKKREAYNIKYSLHYNFEILTSNGEYEKDLSELSEVLLPKYLNQIIEAHKNAVRVFRDSFIFKLRKAISTVKTQIDELNIALKDSKFGSDTYQFSVAPNRDYQDYYDMITDENFLNTGDADDLFTNKYKDRIEELINVIVNSDSRDSNADQDAQVQLNVDKYTDYRTYLVFDLHVKSAGKNYASSLARDLKSKSGGETQTPFYISILASFAQLYRVSNKDDNNTLRLVIFDEAFSKMDASRISQSVKLLRSMGLQVILSTPTEKVSNLASEVDLILVAYHTEKQKRSYLSRYIDKNKKEIAVTE